MAKKRGIRMATPTLESKEIKFSDFDKFKSFAEYSHNKNKANQMIKKMLDERHSIPKRKK